MAATKRQRVEDEPTSNGSDNPPARRRRTDYSDTDAQLAKIYNDLADDIQSVRLQAAGSLLKNLSIKSPDRDQRIKDVLTRLVRGLCSGRKAARLGFSVALSEVLRLAFELASKEGTDEFKLDTVTEKVTRITQTEGNVKAQEKREHLLGRRFAFQAILQSDIALSKSTTDDQWRSFVDAVANLAAEKQWIRAECGAMLNGYLEGIEVSRKSKERMQTVLEAFHEKSLLKTPEGVALWLFASSRFPKIDLPKGVWHGNDPLSSEESVRLKKVLHGSVVEEDGSAVNASATGLRQTQPSFAWKVIFSHLFGKDGKAFQTFWRDAVDHGLFAASSSNERKFLGLQIVSLAVATAPASQLRHVLSDNVIRCLINQRAEPGRYLFEAAKVVLNSIVSRARADSKLEVTIALIERLFDVGAVNFDQISKTKTIESILAQADPVSLQEIVPFLQDRILRPKTEDEGQVDLSRRTLANIILDILRSHHDAGQLFKEKKSIQIQAWLQVLLHTLVQNGYCKYDDDAENPPLSAAHRSLFQARLTSCLTCLLQQSLSKVVVAVDMVIDQLRSSNALVHQSFKKDTKLTLEMADKLRDEAKKQAQIDDQSSAVQAYRLLFALSILQVYNEELESVDVLKDLCSSYQDRDEGDTATAMIVEILLSFLSKPSALFRKLAEQVFATFAPELTADSMQSMLDILQQKESLSGQQELFDRHGGDEVEGEREEEEVEEEDEEEDEEDEQDSEDEDDGDDKEAVDAEEDSDVEIVNGNIVGGDGSAEEENSSSDSDSEEDTSSSAAASRADDEDEDEETAFSRKLAAALGTTDMEMVSDDDGSDMDDDQMMQLDSHLTTIFQERSKLANSSKKQENKEAKENMITFKNRVLDLLAIYVKSQYANPLALDLILPLTMLVRTSTSKPTTEKAFTVLKSYFDACTKQKSPPQPHDPETCFKLLADLHAELKLGGSKLHISTCSRSGLFLAKILVGLDRGHYRRIAGMYAELQGEWYVDAGSSRVQGSVFTEWTSWSLGTRKVGVK